MPPQPSSVPLTLRPFLESLLLLLLLLVSNNNVVSATSRSFLPSATRGWRLPRQSALLGRPLFGIAAVPRAGSTDASSNSTSQSLLSSASLPLPLSQQEVQDILDEIPVYSITDFSGQGVVLRSKSDNTSVLNFYTTLSAANATLDHLLKIMNVSDDKDDTGAATSSPPAPRLTISAYKLGQVYFRVLSRPDSSSSSSSSTPPSSSEDASAASLEVPSKVQYRLVPDPRDLMGARLLDYLNNSTGAGGSGGLDGGDGTTLPAKTVSTALDMFNKNGGYGEGRGKFGRNFGDVPIFIIQQMRLTPSINGTSSSSKASSPAPRKALIPLYFSLNELVATWQSFVTSDSFRRQLAKDANNPAAALVPPEPAIHSLSLDEVVAGMLSGSAVDFDSGGGGGGGVASSSGSSGKTSTARPFDWRNAVFMPPVPRSATQEALLAQAAAAEGLDSMKAGGPGSVGGGGMGVVTRTGGGKKDKGKGKNRGRGKAAQEEATLGDL